MRSRILKVLLLLLVIALVMTGVFFLLSRLKAPSTEPIVPESGATLPTDIGGTLPPVTNIPRDPESPAVPTPPVRTPTAEEQFQYELVSLGKDFAARYGSFSAQNPYQNYRDLFPLVTPRLRAILESQITKAAVPAYYLGITSRAYSGRIIDFAPGQSRYRLEVGLQRVETKNSNERTFYQTILVTMARGNDAWLVDEAVWQPEEK